MSTKRRNTVLRMGAALYTATVVGSGVIACSSDPSSSRPRASSAAGNGGMGATGGSAAVGGGGAGGDIDNPGGAGIGGFGGTLCDDCGVDASVGDGGTIMIPRTHVACDEALELASQDAMDGARAIGVCPGAGSQDTGTGFQSASYADALGASVSPDPLQIGLVDRFGSVEPREGGRMLLLSTGAARAPDQAGYTSDCDTFTAATAAPEGFPAQAPRCLEAGFPDVLPEIYDPAALSLELEVPAGAVALSVDFNFYSSEFPDYVCGSFNDFFVLLMDPPPAGARNGNIAFDEEGNPISVSTGLLRACDPAAVMGLELPFECDLGTDSLIGTGFAEGGCRQEDSFGGSTGWLTTTVSVTEGTTITLRFVIWDTGAPTVDSSVLIDNLRFIGDDVITVPPMKPGTKPSGPI